MGTTIALDEDRCYKALVSRDARFDGQFIAGITSTGIYCRASCPAPVRPKRANVRVFTTAAAAQAAGFRSCKRCRPDASPGSPEWDRRGDLVGRAMRLIESGEIDRSGVGGVAARLHISERHLHRVLTESVGASPIALARAHRANLARILLETTDLAVTDVAFAAGFSSIRQFNDSIRCIYARSPSELRAAGGRRRVSGTDGVENGDGVSISVRLPYRPPFDRAWLFDSLERYRSPGVSAASADRFARVLRLDGGVGHVQVTAIGDTLTARFTLPVLADLAPAIAAMRRLLDLDADPLRIGDHFRSDRIIGRLMERCSGIRVLGSVDGFESAVGTILSQQVSLAGARTIIGRLVERWGDPYDHPILTHAFPRPEDVVDADLSGLGMTTRRQESIRALARSLLDGSLDLNPAADRGEQRRSLLALPGVGPWTTDIVTMRVLRDPDILLENDLVVGRVLDTLDVDHEQRERWSPWRSYVTSALRAEAGKGRR